MSGGEKSEGVSLDRGRTGSVFHIMVGERDTVGEMVAVSLVRKPRKLEVKSYDSICYPVVITRYMEREAELAETVEINKTAKVAEVTERTDWAQEVEKALNAEKAEHREAGSVVLADTVKKMNEPQRRKRRGFRVWGSRVGALVVAVVALAAVALVGLRLAGFRTFTVMSGSMDPEYPVGAMIYVKPVNYYDLKVGDVISYVANDDKTVVTHRIAEIEVDADDASVWRFKTKGDANNAADSKLVHYKNVLGTPIITIPYIGYLAHNIQQPPGIYIALVVGTLLLAWTFLPGTLEERRKTARKSVA
ncbi:signal peptidase I [Candidatus Saccharibacteria bacterium]|nr:signal peptidase I [Candidatus Saccharibacteria bacterium]